MRGDTKIPGETRINLPLIRFIVCLMFIASCHWMLIAQATPKTSQTTRFPKSSGVPAPPKPAEASGDDAQSEEAPERGDLIIRKSVRQVIVDVAVTDPSGKPVHGLKREDFSISEDGAAQTMLSFEAHSLDTPSTLPSPPHLPSDTFINLPRVPEKGPLYVLVLDLVNTDEKDQMFARQQLLKFINEKPEGTRFCILVLARGLHLIHGFTNNKEQLYAALNPAKPNAYLPKVFLYGNNNGRGDPVLVLSAITSICQFLNGLPERKNLIWMAGYFPLSGANPSPDFVHDYSELVARLTQAQAAIYPIDVHGLEADDPSVHGTVGQGAAAIGSIGGSSLSFQYMGLDRLAQATGGVAVHGRNDLKDALVEVVETAGEYYTLVYAPSNQVFDGQLRKIHVSLSRHNYNLAYRSSYYALDVFPQTQVVSKSPGSSPSGTTGNVLDSLYANMQHGAPMAHQIVFRAKIHTMGAVKQATPEQMENLADPSYFRARRKNKSETPLQPIPLQTYAIEYTLPPQAREEANLEFAAAVFDGDGRMLNGVLQGSVRQDRQVDEIGAPIRASKDKNFYRAQQLIEAPLNAASIRIAIRDTATNQVGAMEIDLPVGHNH